MTSFSVIDETFDPNISLSYFLSIQIDLDGFSFSTLDPVRNKYIQLRHISFSDKEPIEYQIERFFEEIEILNLPFKKTLILVPSRQSTLVPSGIFDPALKNEWLNFCVSTEDDHLVLFNKIKMADTYNVFSVSDSIYKAMIKQFPEPVFFHQHTPLIESNLSTRISGNDNTSLFINLNKGFFDVVAFGKNHLKLCNSFPIKSDNDFIYFTLFVFEQLKLEPAKTEVILSGWHPQYASLYKHLTNYVRNIKQTDLPDHFQYSYQFRETRMTSFYNLLSLPLCV